MTPPGETTTYARRLGLFSATMVVMGGIIGSGIFLSPAIVAQRVVNRLVTTFEDANIRAAQAQSRRRRVFLEAQLKEIALSLAGLTIATAKNRTR